MKNLKAVVSLPYVTPSGRLVAKPGHDPETALYLHLRPDQRIDVERSPSLDEVAQALKVLTGPFSLYRFTSPDDAAAALASIVMAVVRPVLDLCPGIAVDAAQQASGKTVFCRAIASIRTGQRVGVHALPNSGGIDDVEMGKVLLSSFMNADGALVFDNCKGHLSSGVLASYLTGGSVQGRVLGQSRVVDAEPTALVMLSGNQLSLDADLLRRFVHVRIDGGLQPTGRAFAFDPAEVALTQRMAIGQAVCTLLMGYFAAGAPLIKSGDCGGYRQWSGLVRQPVLWAASLGLTDAIGWGPLGDPAASMLADVSLHDPEIEALGDMLVSLHALSEGRPFAARECVAWVEAGDGAELDSPCRMLREAVYELRGIKGREALSVRSMGRVLLNRRDRWVRSLALRTRGMVGHSQTWQVVLTTS